METILSSELVRRRWRGRAALLLAFALGVGASSMFSTERAAHPARRGHGVVSVVSAEAADGTRVTLQPPMAATPAVDDACAGSSS
jgi:hypothetical protein